MLGRYIAIFFSILMCWDWYAESKDKLDLAGTWKYKLSDVPVSIPGEGEISLPGSLDNAHKTIYNPEGDHTSQLRREFSFTGNAVYSRKINIPQNWESRKIYLFIERTKPSVIRIDGKRISNNSRISSPQRYDLTGFLTPGTHDMEIEINNSDSIPPIVARSSNAVSEFSQTNWNGILGDFYLEAKNPFHIKSLRIDDGNIYREVKLIVSFSENAPDRLSVKVKKNDNIIKKEKILKGSDSLEISIPIEENELWSSINPNLQKISLDIIDSSGRIIDNEEIITGFRNFSTSNGSFINNGHPVFLRGTVNSAVFPLTTHAPVDIDSWTEYFSILKEYGINHVRFHSWTPPDAAFQAADKLGFYILSELPIWGELDRDLKFHNRFLNEELRGIMESYSHHPSFVMFSTGNELWGDISLMGEYMKEAKLLNPRLLATYGSNVYLGMNGQIGEEDFIVASKTSDSVEKSVRGSVSFADSPSGGHFNSTYPESDFNFSYATEGITVPVISHEAGQYQSYPDFSEIDKFTGNLKADNLKVFKMLSEGAGLGRKSKKFLESSGKWSAKLYKAEMELAQRSPGIGGIELFGLQDYPGQGTALVGLLNPFMESKGFINPEEFRRSASDLTVLAEFPKFSFTEGELMEIPLLTVNFTGNPDILPHISWLTDFEEGVIDVTPGEGIIENGEILIKIPKVSMAQKKELVLKDHKGKVLNEYDFWIYPKSLPPVSNVTVTNNLTEALDLLDQGARVILSPDSSTVAKASLDPLFTPDFWNYRMYRSICDEMGLKPSPGTLGLYINSGHPALKKFPTDNHTDWQWYPIVANSRPLIIDRLPKDFDPIVEVIDNVERNFRLSLMLECNVGKGKLIILTADLDKVTEFPEGKWFLQSVKEYAAGKDFNPALTLSSDQLVNLVTKPSNSRLIRELKNETYSTKWE